jgi:hypothetical protein
MEEYLRDKKIAQARKMMSLLSVPKEQLTEFDGLCKDLDLTVADVTGWQEDLFFNPQQET